MSEFMVKYRENKIEREKRTRGIKKQAGSSCAKKPAKGRKE